MVTLDNVHLYTLVCINDRDHYVAHSITRGMWSQLSIGTVTNPPIFASEQYIVRCPINVFYPMSLIKGNPDAQIELIISLLNQYMED